MDWIQQNGKYNEKPELFKSDKVDDDGKSKYVCIACKRVGHTADRCRSTASGSAFPFKNAESKRSGFRKAVKEVGRVRSAKFLARKKSKP